MFSHNIKYHSLQNNAGNTALYFNNKLQLGIHTKIYQTKQQRTQPLFLLFKHFFVGRYFQSSSKSTKNTKKITHKRTLCILLLFSGIRWHGSKSIYHTNDPENATLMNVY